MRPKHEGHAQLDGVVRRLGPAVYRRCLKMLGRHEEAADASQEVFLRIVRHAGRLPPEDEQLRWAYTIATRTCLNRLRDGRWERPVSEDELPPGDRLFATPPKDEPWLADRLTLSRVLRAHDEQTATLAWLVHVDGFTQEEAGELLGISRKTVGKKLGRFLDGARALLEEVA